MKTKKILVVEDHKDSCLWITAVLRQTGFATSEAGDGTMALRAIRSESPDLVLLDMHLPCGGGMFVLESVRKQPEFSELPFIVISGEVDLDEEMLATYGVVKVLRKPVDVHNFLREIRNALAESREELSVPA
jgi:CheY-like chemotaxis protein